MLLSSFNIQHLLVVLPMGVALVAWNSSQSMYVSPQRLSLLYKDKPLILTKRGFQKLTCLNSLFTSNYQQMIVAHHIIFTYSYKQSDCGFEFHPKNKHAQQSNDINCLMPIYKLMVHGSLCGTIARSTKCIYLHLFSY